MILLRSVVGRDGRGILAEMFDCFKSVVVEPARDFFPILGALMQELVGRGLVFF